MLERLLGGFIREGRLTVVRASGKTVTLGAVPADAPPLDVVVRLVSRFTALKVLLRPALGFGEAYMNGEIRLERGSIADLFELANRNLPRRKRQPLPFAGLARAMRRR